MIRESFAISALVLGSAAGALAQHHAPSGGAEPQEPVTSGAAQREVEDGGIAIRFSLTTRATMGVNAEFDGAPGDLGVSRIFAELGAAVSAGDAGQVQLSLDYEFSHYDFSDATGFVAGVESPFEDVHRTFLTARYSRQQTRQFVWYIGGLIGTAAEEGADFGSSIEGGGFAGARFHLSEQLSIGAGFAVVTQLEDDPLVFPTALFEWEFAPGWSLGSGGRPGLTLAYSPSEELRFALSGFYESRDFRLDEDGPVPDGVARERQIPVSLAVEYTPAPRFTIGAAAGVNFARSYEVSDEDGDEIADIDGDPAPFAAVSMTFRF